MATQRTEKEKQDALLDALAESVLEAGDAEILEDLRAGGIDPDREAARLKAMMLTKVETYRQRALRASRADYERQITRMGTKTHRIPETSAARRNLFALLTQQPQFAQFVTAQYRDLEALTDADIETYLEDLAELGLLEKLGDGGTDGK